MLELKKKIYAHIENYAETNVYLQTKHIATTVLLFFISV